MDCGPPDAPGVGDGGRGIRMGGASESAGRAARELDEKKSSGMIVEGKKAETQQRLLVH